MLESSKGRMVPRTVMMTAAGFVSSGMVIAASGV